MPKRIWGYDKDGEQHSFVASKLPAGFVSTNPNEPAPVEVESHQEAEASPKRRGRPPKIKDEINGE